MPSRPLALICLVVLSGCGGGTAPEDEPCGELDLAVALAAVIEGEADTCEVEAYQHLLDELSASTGPWSTDIRLAHSDDAMDFALRDGDSAVVESAGVPELAVGDDGLLYLFTVDGDLDRAAELAEEGSDWFVRHGLVGYGALRQWVSDDGVDFVENTDFYVEGIVKGLVVDPDVVRQPDGSWALYYMGLPLLELLASDWADETEQHMVWKATSDDLVHWQQAGLVCTSPFADPTVHCAGDDCLLLSYGIDASVSTDGGATFTYQGSWQDIWGFAPEFLEVEPGALRLLFNSRELGAPMLSRFSPDEGETWGEEKGLRLDSYGEAPTVVPWEDGWLMAVHDFKTGTEPEWADW